MGMVLGVEAISDLDIKSRRYFVSLTCSSVQLQLTHAEVVAFLNLV